MRRDFIIFISFALLSGGMLFAEKRRSPSAVPGASITSTVEEKPIEIHGQTRNLNMLLKLQSEREEIDFIKLRKDYEEEIENLNY